MRKGFTLLELIIVIIIIGVLATLGFTQYTKLVEKGRAAEAKTILGGLRTAQQAYMLEYGAYTITMANLGIDAPTACTTTHHFSYSVATAGSGIATRCLAGGKTVGSSAYTVSLSYAAGTFGGTAGYF
ncbi:MAG: type IV pilin-like G/H family protein [Candidatus Omnitrophota bacterium]|nr:type IV pilin-like G/H family protein [Candidatus Omnitrophota bacterium]